MPRTAQQYAEQIQEMWDRAEIDGRDLTPDERVEMTDLLARRRASTTSRSRCASSTGCCQAGCPAG